MHYTIPIRFMLAAVCSCYLLAGCNNEPPKTTPQQLIAATNSVKAFTDSIAVTITLKGPSGWLDYFENTPSFFMASDGNIAFVDYDSAKAFIQNVLVKNIRGIKPEWSNMRIDALTPSLATIAANFHEDITDNTGKTLPYNGYFTATADLTAKGWKLRNLHWSLQH